MPQPHGTALLMTTLLIVGGCSGEHENNDSRHANISLAPAQSAPSAQPAPTPAPVKTKTHLSLLEPDKDRCEWRKLDLTTQASTLLATIQGDCRRVLIATAPDEHQALIVLDPRWQRYAYPESTPWSSDPADLPKKEDSMRLLAIDAGTGMSTSLPLPPRGTLSDIGYNAANQAMLYTWEEFLAAGETAPATVMFENQELDVPSGEGLPAFVHAFRLTGNRWERIETLVSRIGYDHAPGIEALGAARARSPSAQQLLSPDFHDGQTIEDPALQAQLKTSPVQATDEDGQWQRMPSTPLLVWALSSEYIWSSGALLFEHQGRLQALPEFGLSEKDLTALQPGGHYLLVTRARSGDRPRVYDLKNRTLIYRSDTAMSVTFWPQ